jgi:hypothetical protein
MDLEVVIEGVPDLHLAKEIEHQIRQAFRDNARPGQWRVAMSPSETRGQWDLGVRGPSGFHLAAFPDRSDRLPELVAAQLRTCL